ncbi:MAG: zinc ribbon domain-containing protein [Kiritimatiellia bacterium]
MPIYEYKCKKCGKYFEHLARRFSEPVPKCPKCGAAQTEKQLSSFSAGKGGGNFSSSCPTGTCPLG